MTLENHELTNELDSEAIIQWITLKGMHAENIPDLIDGLIQQLNQQHFAIFRSVVIVRTLHPEIEMIHHSWKPADAEVPQVKSTFAQDRRSYQFGNNRVDEITFQHGSAKGSPAYKESPFQRMDDGEIWLRRQLQGSEQELDFPILHDLKALGASDYLAVSLDTQGEHTQLNNVASWTTNKPEGFKPSELALFKRIVPFFALCLEMHVNRYITETLLSVYLGSHSGRQVLHGKIQRGNVDSIDAAIWYSDLRDFTHLSEKVDSETLVSWLNDYFETMSQVISRNQGEILKFVGDAILAIFPISNRSQSGEVCASALQATLEAHTALVDLNLSRELDQKPVLKHGIALHKGTVQYGNIGALRRLDFTVIGKAVNLTARIEGLCSRLKRDTLVSANFASHIGRHSLNRLGEFDLKGVKGPQAIYSLMD